MAEKKRGLGRGLSALMADVAPRDDSSSVPTAAERRLPIERVEPNPEQPRRDFEMEPLQELADSIREHGIIQPLIVRENSSKSGTYQIVAGERRWRAAQMAQLHEVPVIIRDFSDEEVLEVAIVENIQRKDLNPIDEAHGYRQLVERFGHTQEHLAKALGKSRSHLANLMRLLQLPEDVQRLLRDGRLSSGHARALITSENASELARTVVQKGLSVRDTEKLAKGGAQSKRQAKPRPSKDADTQALENDLSANLGFKVSIEHAANGSGKMILSYRDLDDLDALCRLLTATPLDVSR
ncbi:ParB/RepB/Spo0J family partition protein [Vannielia litorea]|uniref:ParB/RepB/Spo0J family partition protein n=1 Tax=Vannielia litorea TaxID=1217970 RepID=UPI001C989FEF|nr:ParB/RepB/Spo0J family partition protein [Vannielia litorea]MBY6049299.1 ParB/RepB/Spo0J family partition protein [Vannielia litorea]MBY6076713.1 ParB/RepB/Spo0J family partition protein [Vannielia litorea]